MAKDVDEMHDESLKQYRKGYGEGYKEGYKAAVSDVKDRFMSQTTKAALIHVGRQAGGLSD